MNMAERKMKDSGIEWIGKIPEGWRNARLASLYSLRATKVSDIDYPPLSVTMQGIVPQLDTAAKTNDHNNRKLVKKGDFAINSRSDRRGSCGISQYDGSVSLINTVLSPNEEMCPQFFDWLFHTTQFADEFYKWGHGIVDDLWTTGWQDMKKINVAVPPLAVQYRIADFLDVTCSEIDALTADIQSEIDTLEKYKKSIITEAVTKGLDKNVKMKDSGIEWIGEIPENWDVKRTKYICDSLSKGNGITKEDVKENGNIACIRYGEIYSKYENEVINCFSYTNLEIINSPKLITKGDILFAGTGELVEEIGKNIVYMGDEQCLAGGDIIVMKHSQNPMFLNYALNSSYAQAQKSTGKAKLKVVHISATDIGNILIAVPPRNEQDRIADTLNKKCTMINKSIAEKNRQLELLDNYKKSIIYEYVTGKKEVPVNE
jgi:type I restriction enzyme S subunit